MFFLARAVVAVVIVRDAVPRLRCTHSGPRAIVALVDDTLVVRRILTLPLPPPPPSVPPRFPALTASVAARTPAALLLSPELDHPSAHGSQPGQQGALVVENQTRLALVLEGVGVGQKEVSAAHAEIWAATGQVGPRHPDDQRRGGTARRKEHLRAAGPSEDRLDVNLEADVGADGLTRANVDVDGWRESEKISRFWTSKFLKRKATQICDSIRNGAPLLYEYKMLRSPRVKSLYQCGNVG